MGVADPIVYGLCIPHGWKTEVGPPPLNSSSTFHGLRTGPLPCDLEWKFETQTVLFPFALLEVNRVDCCVM